MRAQKKPLIGITVHYDNSGTGFSPMPWYALRENHPKTLSAAGAVPIMLPCDRDSIPDYVRLLDGLVVSGGDFDIDPSYYGETIQSPHVKPLRFRTDFELEMVRQALDKNIPVLGICGGHQVINVLMGGTIIQHIPDTHPSTIAHEQPNPRSEPGHSVMVQPGTLLEQCVHDAKIMVNSAHHQAIKTVGDGLIVNALAEDGIIEGVEHPGYRFCLGLQWHPEFSVTEADDRITQAFVEACRG